MNNAERETLAIYISMLFNGLYFILMMYVVIQAKKGVYIFDIKTVNYFILFFSAITSRIINTYLDKKYSDESLRNQAMENSLVLSYLYIVMVIIERVFFVAVFFLIVWALGWV